MRTAQEEGQRLEALLPWVLINIASLSAYLLFASVATAILSAGTMPDFGVRVVVDQSLLFFFGAGLTCVPGTALWLIIVARLSPELSAKKRRIIAAAIAPPLIGLLFLLAFIEARAYLLVLIYGVVLPAGSALVIRLRGFWRPSRFENAY